MTHSEWVIVRTLVFVSKLFFVMTVEVSCREILFQQHTVFPCLSQKLISISMGQYLDILLIAQFFNFLQESWPKMAPGRFFFFFLHRDSAHILIYSSLRHIDVLAYVMAALQMDKNNQMKLDFIKKKVLIYQIGKNNLRYQYNNQPF